MSLQNHKEELEILKSGEKLARKESWKHSQKLKMKNLLLCISSWKILEVKQETFQKLMTPVGEPEDH